LPAAQQPRAENNVILHGEMSCLREAGTISFPNTIDVHPPLSPCCMCAGALALFKVSLVVDRESVTFPGSKDILRQVCHPPGSTLRRPLHLHDEELASIRPNERLWQGDIGTKPGLVRLRIEDGRLKSSP